LDDERIIALLYARDEAAIAELESKYGGLLMSLISRILTDRRDAEEAMNGVLMKLWESIPPARPENLQAYAAKAARNEAITRYRRLRECGGLKNASLEDLGDILPAETSIEDEFEAKLLSDAINAFLGRLDPRKRTIFVKRYWCFESVREIAAAMELPESKVSDILFKTKRSLKRYLIKERLINE
jgi:RNA polymerase sigma-70 factor (ECF subfamily)